MTEILDFVKAGMKVRAVTAELTAAAPQVIVRLPANTRIISAVFNTRTAFTGGTTTCDVGVLGSLESIIANMDVSAVGSAIPTTEWADYGYKTTVPTDIYLTAGAGNSAGEVHVSLLLALSTDIRM